MFGIFCFANSVFVTFFLKETKGRTLEDMDILFGTVDEAQRAADVEQVLNKTHMAQAEHSEHVEMPARDVEGENKQAVAEYSREAQLMSETEFAEGLLTINSEGYPIIDEIIVSFAFAEAKRRESTGEASKGPSKPGDLLDQVSNLISVVSS